MTERVPVALLAGNSQLLFDVSLQNMWNWKKPPLREVDFVFAYISEPVCSHEMAAIWSAIANRIPVYLFFEPGIDRELFWHCRQAAVQWMGFTTIHRDHLPALFEDVIAAWLCRQ